MKLTYVSVPYICIYGGSEGKGYIKIIGVNGGAISLVACYDRMALLVNYSMRAGG